MYADMVPTIRDTLGVTSAYDNTTILPGIRRAATFLLRTYNFPRALMLASTVGVALNTKQVALPAAHVGKIVAVRLVLPTANPVLYKRLRRTMVAEPPRVDGPVYYWRQGNNLVLDTAMPEAGYTIEIYYMTTDPGASEAWISADFEDILFTLAVLRLAQDLRKPEVHAAFNATWQEQVPTLAMYLNEVEFNDLDIRMVPMSNAAPAGERYPS